MSAFTALNIEPDDHTDDEVDNTREIQIEDTLKLYQAALKLHSLGPAHYPQAAQAYTNLFGSEVFKYPESQTEYDRVERNPEVEFADAAFALELAAAGADGAPSTLPQILHLSYKNHGQFILDCVKRLTEPLSQPALVYQVEAAAQNFTLGLASDESDTDLWRRTARVGAMLGSRRISRYCLEAAVEVDDDPTVAEVEPASLEEGFAGEQLKEQLQILSDATAASHPIMAPFRKRPMPDFLIRHMDPYPFLPNPTKVLGDALGDKVMLKPRMQIPIQSRTWAQVGNQLLENLLSVLGPSTSAAMIQLPPDITEAEEPLNGGQAISVQDEIMRDPDAVEPKLTETNGTTDQRSNVPQIALKAVDLPLKTTQNTMTISLSDDVSQATVVLPSRKRSQSTAGLRSTPEDDSSTQKRSKRIRARDNTVEEVDMTAQYAEQLRNLERGDEDVFTFVGAILEKLGVNDLGTFYDLQSALSETPSGAQEDISANIAVRDLRCILRNWNDSYASTFGDGVAAEILGASAGSANAGLAAFLEHSHAGPTKVNSAPNFVEGAGLTAFAEKIELGWMPLQDIICEWLRIILPTYGNRVWPDELKKSVARLISFADTEIFSRLQVEVERARFDAAALAKIEDMIETIFELHIDVYTSITNPNSTVIYSTRITTKDRLNRWAGFAADIMGTRKRDMSDELSLRYLWASVFYAVMADEVSREHKVLCWTDLQALIQESATSPIELPNNAVMPEISIEAADREVSRLTTMDFFFNLFQTDQSDPVAIIETLEPVLEPESACERTSLDIDESASSSDAIDGTSNALRDMWKFLKSGSTSLRLFLWQRLREAYLSIGYNTKVFSCHLKSLEVIVSDLRSSDYTESAEEPRKHKLLRWLKALDDLLVKALTTALNDAATCFEIIDERHIKSTCSALAQLNRVLHSAALFDDEVRIGITVTPAAAGNGDREFTSFTNKLREMQVRTWALQYTMIKEAMSQNQKLFKAPDKDLADYLALVHHSLGMRKFCRSSNKIFLKMMKVEMNRLKHVDKWEDYLGQVLFDLYGIKLGCGTSIIEDHGCPTEQLDRRTVLNIVDQVIVLANRMPIKDLLKHELKQTIERMQTAVGQAKPSIQMSHNLRNCTELLKTSIRPLDMHKAWKGQIQVDSVPVSTQESPLAEKGWYFMLGMISLTKFRSQKRMGPGTQTDDLKVAATFLRLQLQFNTDQWETWFRLAQCFDYELEEEVIWSADKINNHQADLVRIQRSSIHCYIMALSTSIRSADDSFETATKLSEMYHDFGMRLYASSREPFSMEAFWMDGFEKHMSGPSGMYKRPLHDEMSRYSVWKYASRLFRESLRERPESWMNHYMLGKCLWKMYCRIEQEWDPKLREVFRQSKPTVKVVIKAFVNAIKTVPKPTKSSQEPILEPHYKLVSVVNKLVLMSSMERQVGADLLQQQTYVIDKGEKVTITDPEEWQSYVLASIRQLRKEDKQHWQHRMIMRSAIILYDQSEPDYVEALAARNELRDSIFTKTMHIQVWKPDAERPGRHCVYMERYVRYMMSVLSILNDKTSMEALVKRVRKKVNDFFGFSKLWTECCTIYLRLIRKTANIVASMDDVFKNVSPEEFEIYAERIVDWAKDAQMTHPALDALRETTELKRLNAKHMKEAPIDDLINDAFAVLYTQVAKTLPGPDPASLVQAQLDGHPPNPDPSASRMLGPMSLNNLVMDMNGTQIPVPVTIAGASEGPRPRKVGIARREVLRRAEAVVNRAPEAPRAATSSSSRAPAPRATQESNAEQPEVGMSPSGIDDTPGEQAEPEVEGNEEESERGSVHDSADDESDLSDVPDMDDVDSAVIFPNLMMQDERPGSSGGEGGSTPKE